MITKFDFRYTDIEGVITIQPFCAKDERGSLIKDYDQNAFNDFGIKEPIKEVFYTQSKRGVIRANHFQIGVHQAKIVRCISGRVYDVITDLRRNSSTYGQHVSFELTGENQLQVYVPKYCAHGYLVLEDSIVSYKADEFFCATGDTGIMWNDVDLNIDWPLDLIGGEENLIISKKDQQLMSFSDYTKLKI